MSSRYNDDIILYKPLSAHEQAYRHIEAVPMPEMLFLNLMAVTLCVETMNGYFRSPNLGLNVKQTKV